VWWTGWTLGPFRKAARLVGNPLNAITDFELAAGVAMAITRSPSNTRDWMVVGPLGKLAATFPYGYDVESDQS